MDRQLLALGRLHFLASFCPLHRKLQAGLLAQIFIPAVNHDCVRFFENDQGQVCAALIWARLSDDVVSRMVREQIPPDPSEWASGPNLWFLDLLAPFDHGKMVARIIARKPPDDPFYFARLGEDGKLRKIVRGDVSVRGQGRILTSFVEPTQGERR